jgi:hypothetical protein
LESQNWINRKGPKNENTNPIKNKIQGMFSGSDLRTEEL